MTWIRRIAAVSILVIVIVTWLYFFLSATGLSSLTRFYLITILIPLVLAAFYISSLVWSKSKPVGLAMLIPAIVTAIQVSFFLSATGLSAIRLLLEPILVPIVFASFYVSILLWNRSKLVALAMLIPTMATAIYGASFFTTNQFSADRYLLITTLIPILLASFYIIPKSFAAKGWSFAIKRVLLWSVLSTVIFLAFLVTAWFAGLNTILTPNPTQPLAGAIGLAIAVIGTIIYAILAYATILKITTESTHQKINKL